MCGELLSRVSEEVGMYPVESFAGILMPFS